ncbi:MAG TPA: hypothetical protein DHW02_25215 [Ktedonobacter sp.]|nr:hypothetical protein [Ktedonobacter sp.]
MHLMVRPQLTSRWRTALIVLFIITLINYIAQVPYYIHFYAVHHVTPAPFGTVLLALTLVFFLIGYWLTVAERPTGGWILLLFLITETAFYLLHNISGAFLKDLPINDPLFLTVSLIGYLNTIVPLLYLIAILKDHKRFLG